MSDTSQHWGRMLDSKVHRMVEVMASKGKGQRLICGAFQNPLCTVPIPLTLSSAPASLNLFCTSIKAALPWVRCWFAYINTMWKGVKDLAVLRGALYPYRGPSYTERSSASLNEGRQRTEEGEGQSVRLGVRKYKGEGEDRECPVFKGT